VAAAFDKTATVGGAAVTTLTTPAFTISSVVNRAAMIGFTGSNDTTGISGSVGGQTVAIVAGTNGGVGTGTVILGGVITVSGAQTATASWTTAQDARIGVNTATAVDQVTPVNNGTFVAAASTSITSVAGDLTVSNVASDINTTALSTNQTVRWAAASTAGSTWGGGDTGPGTANPTHTWTPTTGAIVGMSGANWKQAVVATAVIGIYT
jgi:hypothetical protein